MNLQIFIQFLRAKKVEKHVFSLSKGSKTLIKIIELTSGRYLQYKERTEARWVEFERDFHKNEKFLNSWQQ